MTSPRTTSRLTRLFAPGSHALTLLCFAMAAMLLWSTAPRGDVAAASSASIAQPAVLDLSAPLVEPPASRRFSGERPGGLPGGLPGAGAGARRIADLRPGHRVLALNPDLDAVRTQQPTAVDPPRYRLVSMRIEHRLDDGSVNDVNIQTLQPTSWLARHNVERYRTAPVPLDLEELGVHGTAVVTLIEPCPPIEEGRGAVVLTTVNHLSDGVYELTVTTPAGRRETLTPTANQPFYCLDENDWLPTEELLEGDRLRTHDGEVTVVSVEPLPGRHRVYNLTVETEHAYHVSKLGVVSHNVCNLRKHNGPIHHIASNKDKTYTPKLEKLFSRAGMDINNSPWNRMRVNGHVGPHGKYYNKYVYQRLESAVGDRVGPAAQKALIGELKALRRDIRKNGLDALLKAPASRIDVQGNF